MRWGTRRQGHGVIGVIGVMGATGQRADPSRAPCASPSPSQLAMASPPACLWAELWGTGTVAQRAGDPHLLFASGRPKSLNWTMASTRPRQKHPLIGVIGVVGCRIESEPSRIGTNEIEADCRKAKQVEKFRRELNRPHLCIRGCACSWREDSIDVLAALVVCGHSSGLSMRRGGRCP